MTSRQWTWPSAIAIAVLIAACGGSEESSGSTNSTATEVAPPPTPAPPETTPPSSEVSESTATDPADAKYDFDSTTVVGAGGEPEIITVGGDRETFDFTDPENYLRVDNDVWSFAPPR